MYPRKFCSEIECENPEGSGKGFQWFSFFDLPDPVRHDLRKQNQS